jgi:hypothetical protein
MKVNNVREANYSFYPLMKQPVTQDDRKNQCPRQECKTPGISSSLMNDIFSSDIASGTNTNFLSKS